VTQRWAGAIMARQAEKRDDGFVSTMHISAVALTADTRGEAEGALANAANRIYPGQDGWHERQFTLVGFGEIPTVAVPLPVSPAIRLQSQAESEDNIETMEGMDWGRALDGVME
jgi:hypothetical protein